MNLEATIKQLMEGSDVDTRLNQLVRSGLMSPSSLPLLRRAISKVQSGLALQGAERETIATFLNATMSIVLGDDTIFNRARTNAKDYVANEEVEQIDERDEGKPGKNFAKIAAKAAKKYGSKEAGNRVAGAIRAKILAKEDAAQAIKSAKGVAFDPRYKGGNMTGAVNVINKIGKKQGIKNLADHPEVSSALKRANESRKNDAVEDIENVKKMNESYKTTFNSALDKYNIKSPSELDEGKRKEFFNYVDQQFKKGEL